jgi:hypothetical protein
MWPRVAPASGRSSAVALATLSLCLCPPTLATAPQCDAQGGSLGGGVAAGPYVDISMTPPVLPA